MFKKNRFLEYLPGIALSMVIAAAAVLSGRLLPAPGSVTIALLVGLAAGNLLPGRDLFVPGTAFCEKRVLPFAIALLGVELNLILFHSLGLKAVLSVILIIVFTIVTAVPVGKIFKLSRSQRLLIGSGNAVCGSSAVAGVSSVIPCDEEEVALSIASVNLMGTAGLFLLPLLSDLLNLTPERSALLIGGSLQAVGQVAAAGYAVSDEVGALAILIKMGRVLCLGPVIVSFSMIFRSQRKKGKHQFKFPIPLFILFFFLFSALATAQFFPDNWIDFIRQAAKILLVTAMAAIGFKINFSKLLQQGPAVIMATAVNALLLIIFNLFLAVLLF